MLAEFWIILGMFAVTFGVRYPVLAYVSRITLPPLVRAALKYVPPAVLAAITVPAVVIPDGTDIELSLSNAYLLAGIIAAAVSYRTKNLLWTILIGMAVFLGLRALL